jgi:hypothetical protein
MASIVPFLPPSAQEQVRKDRARLEQSFKLPTGTIERAEQQSQSQRTSSSKSGRSSSRPQTPTPPQPQSPVQREQPVQLARAQQLSEQQTQVLAQAVQRNTGVRTITPQERSGSIPAFTRRADLRSPGQFERESEIIAQVQTTRPTFRGQRTRAQFEQDTAQIMYAEDLFSRQERDVIKPINILQKKAQERIDLGADFDEVNKQFQKESKQVVEKFNVPFDKSYQRMARERFEQLPKADRRRLNILQASQSTQKSLIGVSQFPQRVFRGAFTSYKEVGGTIQKSQPSLRQPPIATRIMSQPDMVTLSSITQPKEFIKEKVRSPDLYGKAVVQAPFVLAGGLGVGSVVRQVRKGKPLGLVIKQGVADASPFKIVEGVYSPKVSSINLVSQRRTVDGITQRTFMGGKGDVNVRGFEVSKKGVSAGLIRTDRPFIEIKAGGGIIRSGTQTTIQPYTTSGVRSGEAFYGKGFAGVKGKGAVANVRLTDGLTQLRDTTGKTTNILTRGTIKTRTGGFVTTTPKGDVFVTGKLSGKPAQQLSYKQIVKQPSVKGIEFSVKDISRVTGGTRGARTLTKTKTAKPFTSPVSEVLGRSQITAPQVSRTGVITPLRPVTPVRTPRVRLVSPLERTQVATQSQFTGTNQYELTTPQQRMQLLSPMRTVMPRQETQQFSALVSAQDSRLVPRTRTRTATIQMLRVTTATTSATRQQSRLAQRQVQRQVQRNVLRQLFRQPSRTLRPIIPRTRIRTPITPRGFPRFKFGTKGSKEVTPSFEPLKVYGRRFGKFSVVGAGRSEKEAVSIGRNWARQTLGVTFKIPGISRTKVTGFKTKKEAGSVLFIEPTGQRLKRGTRELPEIQLYRRSSR